MYRATIRKTVWTGLKQVLLGLYGLCIRVRVVGRRCLPTRSGFIVAANHVTGADSLVIQLALRTRLFFVTSTRWLAGRFSRLFMSRMCDSVPADTGRGFESVAGVRRCVRTLKAGGNVGIYPEGKLNRRGRVDTIHDGAAYLAVRTGAPILPVHVRNLKLGPEPYSYPWLTEAWEGFFSVIGNILNLGIEVELGEPITPERAAGRGRRELEREMERINGELRRAFDRMAATAN